VTAFTLASTPQGTALLKNGWPVDAGAYGLDAPPVPAIGETDAVRARRAEIQAVSEAVFGHSETIREVSKIQQAASLTDPRRRLLTSDDDRQKLLHWETAVPTPTGVRPPLQPWQDPYAMLLFARIAADPDGAWKLEALDESQLSRMPEMISRELVTVDTAGAIRLLSQPVNPAKGNYPGAIREVHGGPSDGAWVTVTDEWAKGQKLMQLRDRADSIVHGAVLNLMRTPQHAERIHAGGIALTVREICTEANRLRSQRRDLDGYKYIHVETCRLALNRLMGKKLVRSRDADGRITTAWHQMPQSMLLDREYRLTEAEPPRKVYHNNEWRTIPRVYEVPEGLVPANPIEEQPGMRRRTEEN
jgi:hypothetical protein